MRKRGNTTALGWRSPWTGDEDDPIPWTYHVWFWVYKHSRIVRHWFGLHDWKDARPGPDRWCRCTWCGKHRPFIGGELL